MLFNTMIQLQLQFFILMAIGFMSNRLGLMSREARKSLADLLIYVILPSSILRSFTSGIVVSDELVKNCVIVFVVSIVVQTVAVYGSRILFSKWPHSKSKVASYAMLVTNSSFIGIPIAQAIFGDLGVLYTAIIQIPMRFSMWTAGLALFTEVDRKGAFRKVMTHPAILACLLGFVLMMAGIGLPGVLNATVVSLSRVTGPLSMLVIGAILADANVKQFFRWDVLSFTALRLAIFPLLLFGALYFFDLDIVVLGVLVILTAMPAGSFTAIMAQKYDGDAEFGVSLVFVTTALSIVTIPMFGLLLNSI